MKKNFTILFLSAIAVSMLADNSAALQPASFEDLTVNADGIYRSDAPTTGGAQSWKSGGYTFSTYVDSSYAPSYYYYDVTVSSLTETTFVQDYSAGYDMKSAAGGAALGSNYAVWYNNYYGSSTVKLDARQTVSGMYVTNNTYATTSMENGDSYAKKFAQDDWFKLTINGYQKDASNNEVKTGSVDFYLADFRTEGNHYIVKDWTWCDLTTLGEVDAIGFELSSSDTGTWGMNTPAYFCFDELGAEAPTGLSTLKGEAENVRKIFRNGQLLIERDGQLYNAAGVLVK